MSLAVRDAIIKRHWEFADGPSTIAKKTLTWRKLKDILAELPGEPSGGLLVVNKTSVKVRQRYYWLQARKYFE
jgi:hypothetical protein